MSSEILIKDTFFYCASPKNNYQGIESLVKLTPSSLVIEALAGNNKAISVKVDDIVGCLCMRNKEDAESRNRFPNEAAISVFLSIYYYSLAKTLNKKPYRKRETILLRCAKHTTFEENCEVIAKWQSAIFTLIQNTEEIDHGLAVERPITSASPRFLIFVNPNSGPGVAVKTFNTRVRAFLGEANISYDLVVTSHQGECKKVIEETPDLTKYAGLVAVSGDGLLYEIYNGLIARNDWEQLYSFPVGIIPQGSGNGLARSLAHFNGEPYLNDPLVVSALNVVKLRTKEIDLSLINTTNHPKLCSFLSVGWGLLADIDIESERLRMIGEARFTVWALARVIRLRTYKATVSYLPFSTEAGDGDPVPLPPLSEPLPENQGWITHTGDFVCVYSSLVPFIGTDLFFAPKAGLNDGIMWLMIVKAPITKIQVAQLLLALDDGSHTQFPWVTYVAVRAYRLVPDLQSSPHQSYLSVDGERLDSQAIQVQVMSKKGRVFSR